jgi:DNA modification methylase
MFSFVGETVLDPFAGSGTTALAAKNSDRNSSWF